MFTDFTAEDPSNLLSPMHAESTQYNSFLSPFWSSPNFTHSHRMWLCANLEPNSRDFCFPFPFALCLRNRNCQPYNTHTGRA